MILSSNYSRFSCTRAICLFHDATLALPLQDYPDRTFTPSCFIAALSCTEERTTVNIQELHATALVWKAITFLGSVWVTLLM